MESTEVAVREIQPSDRDWFIALYRGEPSALLTYCVKNGELEVVSLHAAIAGRGLGSRLLASARQHACDRQCRRLWLITTNDNEPAIGFYTRRGMHLAAVHRGAITESRRLKPEIPRFGVGGRPITDEIEFELVLE